MAWNRVAWAGWFEYTPPILWAQRKTAGGRNQKAKKVQVKTILSIYLALAGVWLEGSRLRAGVEDEIDG